MAKNYRQLLQDVVPRPISSDLGYRKALGQIDGLMRQPNKSRATDDMIELLATLIEQYEVRQGYSDPDISIQDC